MLLEGPHSCLPCLHSHLKITHLEAQASPPSRAWIQRSAGWEQEHIHVSGTTLFPQEKLDASSAATHIWLAVP